MTRPQGIRRCYSSDDDLPFNSEALRMRVFREPSKGPSQIHRVTAIVLVAAAMNCGCLFEPERLPSGRADIKDDEVAHTIHYVTERDGTLVYAFIVHPELRVTTTNNPDAPPTPTGVHRHTYSRDGVWVNGTKLKMPANSPFFAIRRDGTVAPLSASDQLLRRIAAGEGIFDPEFIGNVLRPALGD
ncbi:MAG: hypothetical protein WD066_05025 [Planctomycetaceae bacterium]